MLKTKWAVQPPLLIPPPSPVVSKWLSSSTTLYCTASVVSSFAAVVMNRLTRVRTCGFGSATKATSLHPRLTVGLCGRNSSLCTYFCVIIFLDQAGMSVFTAIVGIRLSYRDHSRHGNQGWCTVLSRPLHILEHWELVWKLSSLKIKMPFHIKHILKQPAIFFFVSSSQAACEAGTRHHYSLSWLIYIPTLFLTKHFWYLSTGCSRKATPGFEINSVTLFKVNSYHKKGELT